VAEPADEPADEPAPARERTLILRADHNGRVYQAAGDQYIVEA
jgi:hypothetical protein